MSFLDEIQEGISREYDLSALKVDETLLSFIQNDLYFSLHRALLSGEYYDDKASEKIKVIIDKFEKNNLDIDAQITRGHSWSNFDIQKFSRHTNTIIKRYLTPFSELVSTVNSNLSFLLSKKDGKIVDLRIFEIYRRRKEISELLEINKKDEEVFYRYALFDINLLLTYLDEYLECNDYNLITLESIQRFLESVERPNRFTKEIADLMIDKSSFLEFKIRARLFSPKENLENSSILIPQTNAYVDYQMKIIAHHKEINEIRSKGYHDDVIAIKDGGIFQVEPFHYLNRYYNNKSNTSSITERKAGIEELITILKLKKNQSYVSYPPFEKIAHDSIVNMLSNTQLRLQIKEYEETDFISFIKDFTKFLCRGNGSKIKSIESLAKRVEIIAEQNNVLDYYCYKVFIEFLHSLIDFIRSQPSIILTSDVLKQKLNETERQKIITSFIDHLKTHYKKALTRLEDISKNMITHEVKPVYLTKKECYIPNFKWEDGKESPLFIHSAYILPNNFLDVKTTIADWQNNTESRFSSLQQSLSHVLNSMYIRMSVEEFEKKVKENEFKVVQIVAMFVSIATFVLINVKIFDSKTPIESFGILLGIGACLFVFNLFFYFIIQAKINKITFKAFILQTIVFLSAPSILAYSSYTLLQSESDKRFNNTIESTVLIQHITDSIKTTDSIYFMRKMNAATGHQQSTKP